MFLCKFKRVITLRDNVKPLPNEHATVLRGYHFYNREGGHVQGNMYKSNNRITL